MYGMGSESTSNKLAVCDHDGMRVAMWRFLKQNRLKGLFGLTDVAAIMEFYGKRIYSPHARILEGDYAGDIPGLLPRNIQAPCK